MALSEAVRYLTLMLNLYLFVTFLPSTFNPRLLTLDFLPSTFYPRLFTLDFLPSPSTFYPHPRHLTLDPRPIDKLDITLRSILDKHAPLKSKVMTVRPMV